MNNILRKTILPAVTALLVLSFSSCTKVKEELFDNGNPKSRIEYRGGKKNGEAREYYPNGYLRSYIIYKNDKENGLAQYYSQNGIISMDVEMKNGIKEGRMRTYFFNGDREMECFYKNDKLEGTQTYFDKMGNRVSEMNYKNDVAEGKYTAWYSKAETINGQNALRATGTYKNGMMDGKWVYYDENEMPVGEANFNQGTGLMTTFYNGEVIRETHYVKNQKEGDEIEYDGHGNVTKTTTYKQDRIVAIDGVSVNRDAETNE